MNKLISLVVLLGFVSNVAMADCVFSRDVKLNADGSYTYSADCNLRVGQMVQDLKVKDEQILDLHKAIDLKDLALKMSEDRANMWMTTSLKLEDRISKIDSIEKRNDWLYFGLGALTIIGASIALNQIHR